MPDRLTYRPAEVAELLGLPQSTVYALLKRGVIDCVRVGGEGYVQQKNGRQRRRRGIVLIPADALKAFLEEHRQKPASDSTAPKLKGVSGGRA